MDLATQRYIDDLADQVIMVYDICVPIRDIDSVVERIGGRVEENPDTGLLCSGSVRKDGWESFCIEISPGLSKYRRTFTIAHALGHLFLHMGFRTDWKQWDEQGESVHNCFGFSTQQEYQAYAFAAALLMPQGQYGHAMERYSIGDSVDMTELSKCFNVSLAAALNRGRFLGYL